MTKFQMLTAAAIAALTAACAGAQTASTATHSNTTAASTYSSARTAQTTPPPAATPAPTQQAQAAPAPTPPAAPTSFTDDQLRSFARAAIEIDPISRTLSTATPEQQATATEQIRAILTRNNLDGATYNAIAAQAQRDPAFAQRIAALNRADQSNG